MFQSTLSIPHTESHLTTGDQWITLDAGFTTCMFQYRLLNSQPQMLIFWFQWKDKLILFWDRKYTFGPVKPVCDKRDRVISCNLRQALENKLPCKTVSSCEKILTFLQGIWKFSGCILAFSFFLTCNRTCALLCGGEQPHFKTTN